MTWAVQFEDVSKRYRGGGPRYPALRHDLAQLVRKISTPRLTRSAPLEAKVALSHVSFEVEQGEAFALIGPNGAGKTTALKLLSRITYPTEGRVRVRGRVAALIDIGAGIHPELTGRENIWLYGRIMGMPRSEIAWRFDDIVEFAEISNALDTPVKMYSSGMQLRLGFAVASHLDPDIFVIDEALAVGDAGFQAKCVERMMKLVTEGRTLLFVSHNLSAVEAVCRRGLFLLDGGVGAIGGTRDVLRKYLDWVDTHQQARLAGELQPRPSRFLKIERISFHDAGGVERAAFRTGEEMEIRLTVRAEAAIPRPVFTLGISGGGGPTLFVCSMLMDGNIPASIDGVVEMSCHIAHLPLLPRVYQTWCAVANSHAYGDILDWQPVGTFRVADGPAGQTGPAAIGTWGDAPIHTDYRWRWRNVGGSNDGGTRADASPR